METLLYTRIVNLIADRISESEEGGYEWTAQVLRNLLFDVQKTAEPFDALVERRFRREIMRKNALSTRLKVEYELGVDREEEPLVRAHGDTVCNVCEFAYHDHPRHPVMDFLTILCDGNTVKL